MTWWHRLWSRKKMEEELDKELRFHLDQHAADLIAQGHDPEEARRQARLALGGPEQVKEKCRDAHGVSPLEKLWHDLRYGARMLMKQPGFTLGAMLTLALGIGVNTALFTVFNVFVLEPLPVRDPESLVEIRGVNPRGERENFFSYIDYLDYRERSRTLAGLALMEIFGVTVGEMRSGRDNVSVWRGEVGCF